MSLKAAILVTPEPSAKARDSGFTHAVVFDLDKMDSFKSGMLGWKRAREVETRVVIERFLMPSQPD